MTRDDWMAVAKRIVSLDAADMTDLMELIGNVRDYSPSEDERQAAAKTIAEILAPAPNEPRGT